MEYRLAIIGFGNVGQGFAEILRDHGPRLLEQFGVRYRIVGVSDNLKGSIHDPAGFDPADLLDAVRLSGNLGGVEAPDRGWDGLEMARQSAADVVVELSYTDLETGEPATGHIRAALDAGKHVVTTNKGPVALHYAELAEMARERGLEIGVEGTVMSGTPTVLNGMNLLRGAGIKRVQGILNGTCNYILTRMEEGSTYEDALQEAQDNGYAEADPTGDVEGFDAAGKVVILANLLMGVPIGMDDVDRTGISGLTPADITAAQEAGTAGIHFGEMHGDVVILLDGEQIVPAGGERDTDSDQSFGDDDDADILTLGVRADYDFDAFTLTSNTGCGNPHSATAAKGRQLMEVMVIQ